MLKGLVARNGILNILLPQTHDFEANTNAHIFKVMKRFVERYSEKAKKNLKRKVDRLVEIA